MRRAARMLYEMGARAVLIKGGHAPGCAIDLLFDGAKFLELPARRVEHAKYPRHGLHVFGGDYGRTCLRPSVSRRGCARQAIHH